MELRVKLPSSIQITQGMIGAVLVALFVGWLDWRDWRRETDQQLDSLYRIASGIAQMIENQNPHEENP